MISELHVKVEFKVPELLTSYKGTWPLVSKDASDGH